MLKVNFELEVFLVKKKKKKIQASYEFLIRNLKIRLQKLTMGLELMQHTQIVIVFHFKHYK